MIGNALRGSRARSAAVDVDMHREDRSTAVDNSGRPAGEQLPYRTRDGLPRVVAAVTFREPYVAADNGIYGVRWSERVVARRRRTFRGELAWQDARRWADDAATEWVVRGALPDKRGEVSPAPEPRKSACYCDYVYHAEGC